MTRNYTCKVGDVVIVQGKKVWISQVVEPGWENYFDKDGSLIVGEKSKITVCRIMEDNGQILKRSPKFIGSNWSHTKS